MQLSVRDLTETLGVPSSAIYRALKRQDLPGDRVLDEYRFNRMQVLDWAMATGTPLLRDLFADDDEHEPGQTPLADARARGGTVTVPGMPLGPDLADRLADAMPELDGPLAATVLEPVGRGLAPGWVAAGSLPVAMPRASYPVVAEIPRALVRTFLASGGPFDFPRDFGGAPIVTWFWILAPTPLAHLQILERLARLVVAGTEEIRG